LPIVGERETVGQYLTGWLEASKAHLRPRSYARYDAAVRLHLLPALGKHPLSKLSAQDIERFYAAKLTRGLAPATVARIHAALHKALADAERHGLVQRNVASLARAPRAPRHEQLCWTAQQAAAFLRALQGDPLEAFYALAINTGMRRGEILALHWADVDLDSGMAQVRYTLQDDKGGRFTFAPPKTEQSARHVPLNQTALAALRRHRARQAEQRLQMGDSWQDMHGLVFTTAIGAPMRGNHILQRHFDPMRKRIGLPRVRLHDLRHTAASLWFDQGYQTEVVSKLLGHSSSTVTSTIYIHVTPDKQREAAAALGRLFG
jgi:integrase